MKLYRGTGGQIQDKKNIGKYYTNLKEEAMFYGKNIEEINIDPVLFLIIDENDEKEYINEWLESLSWQDRDFQESTKWHIENQYAEVLAVNDAKSRGYKGLIIKDIEGECGKICDYVIIFDPE